MFDAVEIGAAREGTQKTQTARRRVTATGSMTVLESRFTEQPNIHAAVLCRVARRNHNFEVACPLFIPSGRP